MNKMRNKIKKKGQIGMEYIIVTGFIMVLVTVMIIIAYNYSNALRDEICSTSSHDMATKIVSIANSIGGRPPSLDSFEVFLPQCLTEAFFILDSGRWFLIYKIQLSSGEVISSVESDFELVGDPIFIHPLNRGNREMKAIALDANMVRICEYRGAKGPPCP